VDEFMVPGLGAYRGKSLRAVDKAETAEQASPEQQEKFKGLLEHLKGKLPEVSDVRLTGRLKESAACLVTQGQVSAHLERLMHRWGQGDRVGGVRRGLELNPGDPAGVGLQGGFAGAAGGPPRGGGGGPLVGPAGGGGGGWSGRGRGSRPGRRWRGGSTSCW